jgi:hypothetical protein
VTVRCPTGHDSTAEDYCDECGAPIRTTSESDGTTVTVVDRCPRCNVVRMPGDRFCEQCRFDFSSVRPEAPVGERWTLLIEADRVFHERLDPTGFEFPSGAPPRAVALDGAEVLVGRASTTAGIAPSIDLAAAPGDPAVSRRHARFVREDDGSYAIEDLDSANGTWLNDEPAPIAPHVRVRLVDGDQVHLGAWTTMTLTSQ